MTKTSAAKSASRLIVALDVGTPDEARGLVEELRAYDVAFKVGLQLFTAAGPGFVADIAARHRVFLDLKFHDIPNTVAAAAASASRLGVWMLNVHAAGGREMMSRTMERVVETCARENRERPLVIGVTVLTSSDANTLGETGIEAVAEEQVVRLARLAADSGLDGVVASPLENAAIRKALPDRPEFVVVTPGVRPAFATTDDQKRVMTPREAIIEGSNYVVVGRPVIRAEDRLAAMEEILGEIEAAENERV